MSPKEQFLKAFKEVTIPVVGKQHRLLGDATLELMGETNTGFHLDNNEVYLSDLRATPMQHGIGTKTMQTLSELADKFNVDIILHAMGTTDEGPSDWTLKQFYKKFGFMKCGTNNEMVRKAVPETLESQPTRP